MRKLLSAMPGGAGGPEGAGGLAAGVWASHGEATRTMGASALRVMSVSLPGIAGTATTSRPAQGHDRQVIPPAGARLEGPKVIDAGAYDIRRRQAATSRQDRSRALVTVLRARGVQRLGEAVRVEEEDVAGTEPYRPDQERAAGEQAHRQARGGDGLHFAPAPQDRRTVSGIAELDLAVRGRLHHRPASRNGSEACSRRTRG